MDNADVAIAVLLATHDGARWLGELLQSVVGQTLTSWRIDALDDASTDASVSLTTRLLEADRMHLHENRKQMGVVATFENLLEAVDTPMFSLCDQDDVWLPDKLEKSVSLLTSSGADLVYTDLRVSDEDLSELAPSMWRLGNIVPVAGRALIPLILKNSVTGCTVVGRTSMLKKALPFPDGIPMHDWWLALVAACGSGVQALHEQTVLYRQHGTNALGAAKFSSKGLSDLVERRHLTMGAYTLTRLSGRLALIRGLEERNLAHLPFLRRFYRLPTGLRLVLSPIYLGYIVTRAHVLGWRNLLVDVALTCLPLGSSSRTVTP